MSDQGGGSQSLDDFENEAPLHLVPRRVITADGSSQNSDQVIGESPVALVFNGISHAVMMATPADLEDFIVGFALCEGLIGRRSDIVDIELRPTKMGIEVDATTTNRVAESMRARRRSMMGPSGCGICGVESLSQVDRELPEVEKGPTPSMAAIKRACDQLANHQTYAGVTSGAHAAAWCRSNGDIICVREDVGRHNAMDKLVGAGLRANPGFPPRCIAMLSGRVSFELVQKAVMARFPVIVAVGAPGWLRSDSNCRRNVFPRCLGVAVVGLLMQSAWYATPMAIGSIRPSRIALRWAQERASSGDCRQGWRKLHRSSESGKRPHMRRTV